MDPSSSDRRLDIRTWAACGFGLGFTPMAPGSVGTAGIAVLWGILRPAGPLLEGALAGALVLLGVWLCGHAERLLGRDSPVIVWDEFAGFACASFLLPKSWPWIALTFGFFRLFDIFKPPPVGASQRLPGGWGVVADDVLAGVYANAAAWLFLALLRA